jgi:hypothetical protein
MGNVLFDLEKISGNLSKLDKIGCDLAKVVEVLCKLEDSESSTDVAKASANGGNGYVS